ncbi:MAG: threonine synthase [Gemmataceae bacterium]
MNCCAECFGPLEPAYPPPAVTRADLASRPPTMWRYLDWLPLAGPPAVALPVRNTPLIKADGLARELGVTSLWIKDEGKNPSGSFKDRLVAVALNKAREFGLTTVICASTGNLGRSVLALAPPLKIAAHVLVPEALAGPKVIAVRGTYDEANRLALQVADARGWAVVNATLHPYYAEGGKTVGHEIAEQLGRLPDHVVCCMAGGTLIEKVYQGMNEFADAGLVERTPVRMWGAQPAGCAPIVSAFKEDRDEPQPVRNPATRIHALAVGDPGNGYFALRMLRESGGAAEDVTDAEAGAGLEMLVRTEGIQAEMAAGLTVAAAKKLLDDGRLPREQAIVLVLTGRANRTAVTGEPVAVINPTREAFDRLL